MSLCTIKWSIIVFVRGPPLAPSSGFLRRFLSPYFCLLLTPPSPQSYVIASVQPVPRVSTSGANLSQP